MNLNHEEFGGHFWSSTFSFLWEQVHSSWDALDSKYVAAGMYVSMYVCMYISIYSKYVSM